MRAASRRSAAAARPASAPPKLGREPPNCSAAIGAGVERDDVPLSNQRRDDRRMTAAEAPRERLAAGAFPLHIRPMTDFAAPLATGRRSRPDQHRQDASRGRAHAGPFVGHDRPAAAIARARDLRSRGQGARSGAGRAHHRRGEDRPRPCAIFRLHGRGDAARSAGRVPRGRRDPALRRPRARPRLHPSSPACARASETMLLGRGDDRSARPPPLPRRRNPVPRAAFDALLRRPEEADPPAAPQRDRRLFGRRGLRHRRTDPPAPRRRGGGDGFALAPHPQRPGRALPVRRGRFSGGDRRHRHGPQHGRRPRRLRRPAQIRRPAHPRPLFAGDRTDRRPGRPLPPGRRLRRHGRRARPRPRRRGRRSRAMSSRRSWPPSGATRASISTSLPGLMRSLAAPPPEAGPAPLRGGPGRNDAAAIGRWTRPSSAARATGPI